MFVACIDNKNIISNERCCQVKVKSKPRQDLYLLLSAPASAKFSYRFFFSFGQTPFLRTLLHFRNHRERGDVSRQRRQLSHSGCGGRFLWPTLVYGRAQTPGHYLGAKRLKSLYLCTNELILLFLSQNTFL